MPTACSYERSSHSFIRRHSLKVGTGESSQRVIRTPSMCRSAVMSAIRPTACRAASTVTTNSTGITACMPTPSGSGQAAAPLNAIVANVSSHAVWRSSGNGIRIQVSSRSSASSTQMPASMPIGNTSEKAPNPFFSASARTAAYEPAKPMPAMTTAPATTTPMSIRCVRVSCIAATRDPLPCRATAGTAYG